MSDQPFTYLLRVRYAECDAQHVVFNGRYADYVDVAVTEYTRILWGDYSDLLAHGSDNQVVSLKIDWQSPARFDDVLAIQVSTKHIGNTSYSLAVDFLQNSDKRIVAKAEIVYVMVSAHEHSKIPIPDVMKTPLEAGVPNVVIDHASLS